MFSHNILLYINVKSHEIDCLLKSEHKIPACSYQIHLVTLPHIYLLFSCNILLYINIYNAAIHLLKTSITSTSNGAINSQTKSNPQHNLIYVQYCCSKDHYARGIITAQYRGEGHKYLYYKFDFWQNDKDTSDIIVIHP